MRFVCTWRITIKCTMEHHNNKLTVVQFTWQLARYLDKSKKTMGDINDPFSKEKVEISAISADTQENTDAKILKVWALNSHITTYAVLDGKIICYSPVSMLCFLYRDNLHFLSVSVGK